MTSDAKLPPTAERQSQNSTGTGLGDEDVHVTDSLTLYDARSAARLTDPGTGIDRAMTWMGLAAACRQLGVDRQAQ